MSKTVDTLVQSVLEGKSLTGVTFVQLHFNPIQRYCSAYQNIYWDEAGTGEEEYLGLGNLGGMSVINETTDLSAQTIQLTLSGIPNAMITDIFDNEYIGKPAYIWYATVDPDTCAVQYASPNEAADGPILLFAGLMDYGTVVFGETATVTVNVTNRLADWERPRGGRFNHTYQQRHVDPTDLGFEYVVDLQSKSISWGSITVDDPYND